MPKPMKSAEMVIITLLKKGEPMDTTQVANETGYSLNFCQYTLKRLTTEGKITRTGKYGAVYEWIDKEPVLDSRVATPRLVNVMAGTYDGRELRPFSARPNAGQLVRRNP